ncbi:MAG: inositol monophosphatase, partial [Dehalococcoidia bacterium]|nr:inositol monophosphatase [Dehalococcoidia bacterium]
DALLASGFAYDLTTRLSNGPVWHAFLGRAQGLRRDGSASLDMAYVAAGRFDGYWEHGPFPWDVAAGVLLVHEAGGRVTDYAGAPYRFDSRRVLASNGRLHAAMVDVLREAGA